MYSDISTRIRASASSNINSASALLSSVFPTPVGPRKRNEPIGRLGSAIPARERFTALATLVTASSCPTTCSVSDSSIRASLAASSSSMRAAGIPVHRETTPAISASVISSFKRRRLRWSDCRRFILSARSRSFWGIWSYRISAAFCKSAIASADSASCRSVSSSFLSSPMASRVSRSLFHLVSRALVFSLSSAISFSISCKRSEILSVSLSSDCTSLLRASRSISSRRTWRSATVSSSGLFSSEMRNAEAASSIRSTALSGR